MKRSSFRSWRLQLAVEWHLAVGAMTSVAASLLLCVAARLQDAAEGLISRQRERAKRAEFCLRLYRLSRLGEGRPVRITVDEQDSEP